MTPMRGWRTAGVWWLLAAGACAGSGMAPETGSGTAPAGERLVGPTWQVTAIGDSPVQAQGDRGPFLVFAADGRVSGAAGCNRLLASYVLDGDALTFSAVAVTRMACAEGMDLERAFLAALDKVRRARRSGDELQLADAAGTPVLRFGSIP